MSLRLAVLALAVSQSVQAVDTATTQWIGGDVSNPSNWGTPGNWIGAGAVAGGPNSASLSVLFNSTFANQPQMGAGKIAQGIWLADGVGQDVTINASVTSAVLTITGTATLNGQTNAGIIMSDSANHNLTIGPKASILLSNNTGFYNQESSASTLTISGGLDLNGKILTIGAGTSSTGNVAIGGKITSASGGSITVNTAGTVTLSGTNTYPGTTNIGRGTLVAGNVAALGGSLTAGVFISTTSGAGTLQLSTDTSVNPYTIRSSSLNQGTIVSDRATAGAGITHVLGTAHLGGNTYHITKGSNVTSGTATVSFASINVAGAAGSTTKLNPTTADLLVTGAVNIASANGNKTLELGGTSLGSTISGVISDNSNGATGTLSLTKSGAGTWTLSGANTYTGTTTISGGTLAFTGGSETSPISVGGSAFIEFTLGTPITSSGNLALDSGAKVKIVGTPVLASYTLFTTTGSISGTPVLDTAIPGYTLVVEGGNTLKLNQVTGGYNSWNGANAGGETPDLDWDKDGVSNGVEYFMNAAAGFTANPALGAGNTITWPNGGNIPASDYGTQYIVQTSGDLVIWADVPVGDLTTNTSGPGGSLTYTLTGSGKRFVRLKVTPTP